MSDLNVIDIAPLAERAKNAPRYWRDQCSDLADDDRETLLLLIETLSTALDVASHMNDELIKLGKKLEHDLSERSDQIERIANSFERVLREPDGFDLVVLAQRRKETCEVALRGLRQIAAARMEPIDWPTPYVDLEA